MRRHDKIVTSLAVSFFLLGAHAFSQINPSRLGSGSAMPSLAGQTLAGTWVDLPGDAAGKPAIVVFTFSHAGGRDAQNWSRRLLKDDPRLSIYTIVFLEGVPRLLRNMVASEIKSAMPTELQDRTILLYQDENSWKQRLQLADESHACVTLLRANGEIQWMNCESFADVRYSELTKQMRVLK